MLAVSLSAADEDIERPAADELRERFLPALAELLPGRARDARCDRFVVTREHAATFRAAPGTAALRPPARTRLPGWRWPGRGPAPAGRRRWRARCAAATLPHARRSRRAADRQPREALAA